MYKVTKSDCKLGMLMASSNQEASYVRLILYKLKLSNPVFHKFCNHKSEIQRLTKSGNKCCWHDKEVNFSSVDGEGIFSSNCYNCRKACGYRAKTCRKCKGDLKGGHTGESKGGNTSNSGSKKMCNFCGVKGHKESQCFKRNPKKASAQCQV